VPLSGLSEGGAAEGQGPVESKYRWHSPSDAGPAQVLGAELMVQNGGNACNNIRSRTRPCLVRRASSSSAAAASS
jgi:hypothetical protein